MIQRIQGRLIFSYGGPKKEHKKLIRVNFKLSLLGALMGIFLLPSLAYLSTIQPEKLIELTNQERQAAGLNPLTANQLLTQAAIMKSQSIVENNSFKHTINDRKFSAWIRDTGYNYSYVGENLAIDFISNQGVMDAWKNSPLHKKNLLSPYYQEIGISALAGKFLGQDTTVVVQIFGAPAVGSITPLTENLSADFFNPSSVQKETDLLNPPLSVPENLLTHAAINQELWPLDNSKLALPADKNAASQVNTFVVQPGYRLAMNNLAIIFLSWLAIYLFIFLYFFYFFKINKRLSA